MGLSSREIENIELAASLHDIGKIAVPDHVLLKPGALTDDEFEWIRNHPEFGWLAFGGNISVTGDVVRITPLDSSIPSGPKFQP
jgi:response regulator RpfG family c-di-GMP phosphodiesterase